MSWTALAGASVSIGSSASLSLVTVTALSVGDTLVVTMTFDAGGAATGGSLTDSLGNTYTKIVGITDSTNTQRVESWYSIIAHAGTPTITLRFTPTPGTTSANSIAVLADPFTGSDASSTNDTSGAAQVQSAPGTGANAVTSGSFSTATDGDLIHTVTVPTGLFGSTSSVGTGFTLLQTESGNQNTKSATAWRTQTTHGAIAGTWTAAANVAHTTIAVAIKPASGGGGGRTFFVSSGLDGLSSSGPKQFNPSLGYHRAPRIELRRAS